MVDASSEPADDVVLLSQALSGDGVALNQLLAKHQERLKHMVRLRLDRRLLGRIDASDVVQEAMLEASERLSEFSADCPMPFFLWLRWITVDKLLNAHRHHLGTKKRNAAKEVTLRSQPMPDACSVSLAQQLLGQLTSPTEAVQRAELQLIVQDTLNSMAPIDREVLVLRHFEQLTTSETAKVLGIKRSTAGKRYIAALKRLKQALSSIRGLDQTDEGGRG